MKSHRTTTIFYTFGIGFINGLQGMQTFYFWMSRKCLLKSVNHSQGNLLCFNIFCKLLFFIYTSDLWVSLWICKVLTFSLSSFTSFFNWSTSILALSKSVRFSTFITGIFCEKTNQIHIFYNTINAMHYCQKVFTFYRKSAIKSTLTAVYGEFSSPWRWTENPSALCQSGL